MRANIASSIAQRSASFLSVSGETSFDAKRRHHSYPAIQLYTYFSHLTGDRRCERKQTCGIIYGLLCSNHQSCHGFEGKARICHFQSDRAFRHVHRARTFLKQTMRRAKKDFVSKLEIALKEASETGYRLELLHRTTYMDEATYKALNDQCTSIRIMLIASCRTAKSNFEQPT